MQLGSSAYIVVNIGENQEVSAEQENPKSFLCFWQAEFDIDPKKTLIPLYPLDYTGPYALISV